MKNNKAINKSDSFDLQHIKKERGKSLNKVNIY